MHALTDFALEALLVPQGAPSPASAASDAAQTRYGLPRAVLASTGAQAAAVCERTLQLAADWLGTAPPLAHWTNGAAVAAQPGAAAEDEPHTDLAALLDHIAQRRLADDLRAAGYELQAPDALLLWLVVSDDAGALPDPARLKQAVDLLGELAWRRLRAQVAVKLLVVTEPANAAALAAWRTQIAVDALHLCSPINLHRLRLSAEEVTAQAATALAALLCGVFPSHTRAPNAACVALGAAGWTAPIAALRRGLALLSARHAVEALAAQLEAGAAEMTPGAPGLALARLPGLEQSDLDLAAAAPPPLSAPRWRELGVAWPDLAGLRVAVETRLARREERHEQTLRAARHAWLDQRMAAWQALVGEVDRLQQPEGDAPPPLARYCANLQHLAAQLDHELDALATALERSDHRLQEAETQVGAAWDAVETLCGQVPPATGRGVLMAALQPWMWPVWPYAFGVLLPQEGQRLLDAAAYRGKVRWHEANWHVLRQAALAMRQDVNRRRQRLAQLQDGVASLRTYLAAQLTTLALPAPWDWAALQRLWLAAKTHDAALAAFPAHETPLDWPAQPYDRCAERLIAHYAGATLFVERWPVLDALAQAFPPGTDGARAMSDAGAENELFFDTEAALPAGCLAWLNGMLESTLPLWPDPAPAPVSGPAGWCLLPPPAAGRPESGRGQDTLRHWRQDVANLAPGALAGRTLAIVRWAPVECEGGR